MRYERGVELGLERVVGRFHLRDLSVVSTLGSVELVDLCNELCRLSAFFMARCAGVRMLAVRMSHVRGICGVLEERWFVPPLPPFFPHPITASTPHWGRGLPHTHLFVLGPLLAKGVLKSFPTCPHEFVICAFSQSACEALG